MNLSWDKLTGLTTDGAPAMCGEKSGLVGRLRQKMQSEGNAGELTAYHCIIHQETLCGKVLGMEHVMNTVTQTVNFIRARGLNHRQFQSFLEEIQSEYNDVPYHTEVRWLSRGKVLERFFYLLDDICQFLETKEKDTARLRDVKWRCELAFLCDVTNHLSALNLQLQGRGRTVTDMYDSVRAFKVKLNLWETQLQQKNHAHFPACQNMMTRTTAASQFPTKHFVEKLSTLRAEFTRRFTDFERQKFNFEMFSNPFSIDPEKAPENLQMELIELQCDSALKSKYETVGRVEFHRCLPETMPQLRRHAARILSMFGSTYVCEQLFSVMKLNKSAHRSSLTDAHLHSILRVSTAQDLTPNITELVVKKRCQVSTVSKQ
ncbi:hypothetical protein WMY93_024287 [Mugilogobius chulae]|uniref:General transcription factor II-I repeat domain-containing protein 2-like n=1 Tax=Mugilogobius chulae TaxID=88201 RepID=A0AAW0N9A3_9GOBI